MAEIDDIDRMLEGATYRKPKDHADRLATLRFMIDVWHQVSMAQLRNGEQLSGTVRRLVERHYETMRLRRALVRIMRVGGPVGEQCRAALDGGDVPWDIDGAEWQIVERRSQR